MRERQIDPEMLAALLDGRLEGARREEALAALASDEAAYEAYVDAVAVTLELKAAEEAAIRPIRTAVPSWRRPGAQRFLIAAGLAALLILPWAVYRAQAPDPSHLWMVEALNGYRTGVPEGWDPAPWGARRSVDGSLTPEARAVRVGAALVDLELAARAGDSERVRTIAGEVARLLDALPAAGPAAGIYRTIADRSGSGYQELAPLLDRGRGSAFLLLEEERVRIGAWTEAARIAAARRADGFFSTDGSRSMLQRLGSDPIIPEPARAAATRASAALAGTPPDWVTLESALAELLALLGRS